jgi:hypothetical protein
VVYRPCQHDRLCQNKPSRSRDQAPLPRTGCHWVLVSGPSSSRSPRYLIGNFLISQCSMASIKLLSGSHPLIKVDDVLR